MAEIYAAIHGVVCFLQSIRKQGPLASSHLANRGAVGNEDGEAVSWCSYLPALAKRDAAVVYSPVCKNHLLCHCRDLPVDSSPPHDVI